MQVHILYESLDCFFPPKQYSGCIICQQITLFKVVLYVYSTYSIVIRNGKKHFFLFLLLLLLQGLPDFL